jgi:ribosomal protein S18 acetylase RimI-like enzyme
MNLLRFRTIDAVHDQEICIRFRRDAFACSFDDGARRFDLENGPAGLGYIVWLEKMIAAFPSGFVHAWDGGQVIGQLELRMRSAEVGYANLFYLCPEVRGAGHGDSLHEYAVQYFRSEGARSALLTVSPTNPRAVRYYERHGWKDLGPREAGADVHVFELRL